MTNGIFRFDMKEQFSNNFVRFFEKINRCIFIVFVFFLPFTYFKSIPSLNPLTYPINFFISIVGVLALVPLLFLKRSNYYIKNIFFFREIIIYLLFLTLLSLFSAFLMSWSFNGYQGTKVYVQYIKNSLYIIHIFVIAIYCFINIKQCRKKHLKIAICASMALFILIGLYQLLLIFTKSSVLAIPYDYSLVKLGLLRESAYFFQLQKVSMTCPEPAWTSLPIFVYFLPFLLFEFFKCKTNKKTKSLIIAAIGLLAVLIIFTKSFEVYGTLVVFIFVIVFYFLLKSYLKEKNKSNLIFLLIFVVAFMVVAALISYLLFAQKMSGYGMYSIAFRLSVCYNDIICFLHSPLIGVGNGLQGYYYFDNVVDTWFEISNETRLTLESTFGIPNGGPFILSFLSGYGLFGFGFSCYFFFILFKKNKNRLLGLGLPFYLSIVSFLVLSTFTLEIVGNFMFAFLLSVPLIINEKENPFSKQLFREINI